MDFVTVKQNQADGFQCLCYTKLNWMLSAASCITYRHKSGLNRLYLTLCKKANKRVSNNVNLFLYRVVTKLCKLVDNMSIHCGAQKRSTLSNNNLKSLFCGGISCYLMTDIHAETDKSETSC